MPSTRIGRRGQITVPKAVRQSMGLAVGDHVAFVERGGDIVLRPVRQSLRDLRGSVPVDGPQDFNAVRGSVRLARSGARVTPGGAASAENANTEPGETDAD